VKRPAVLALAFAVACTSSPSTPARRTTATPSSPPTASATPSRSASPSASPLPRSFGGANVTWPRTSESTPAPPALGAVITKRDARTSAGTTLARFLTLPRIGGTNDSPLVLTPCGNRVTLSSNDVTFLAPSKGGTHVKDVLVLIDPGHGGPFQLGALAPNGDQEKERNLQISLELHRMLHERGMATVLLTREWDFEASLEFRTALADALRADAAISVHLNSSPDGARDTPGTETFGSTADGVGRRFAGLVYEHVRRYTQTLPGPWVGDRDAGAKYRLGKDGQDYYGLLRRSHVPFVISESLYISSPHEASLVARPEVRTGLANALANAVVEFTTGRGQGSGWVKPYPRPADPSTRDDHVCTDPTTSPLTAPR
jgi:N-acetylmuramoyl-L-alanine amidase